MPIKKKYLDNAEINQRLADAWLNIDVDTRRLSNPLVWPEEYNDEPEKFICYVMSRPEYFSFICKEILNIDIPPIQSVMLKELWKRKFPMLIASRGFGKSFMLAVYAILRMLLLPERKVIIAGAAFRQSKVIFEYMETIYHNAPLLRDIIGTNVKPIKHDTDMYTFTIGRSFCKALPIGDGSKIRGQRANDLLTDEFDSIPKAIFENVLAGFASVRAKPIDGVKLAATIKLAKELGIWEDEDEYEEETQRDNQIIISGTAGYDFNHFGQYWKDWHEIICSRGEDRKLKEYFKRKSQEESAEEVKIPDSFNYKDYSIIRIPFEKIPSGFMDAAQVARSKATIHSGIYLMEFGACFSTDSNGFFKRTLIESCVASHKNEICLPSEQNIVFEASLYGDPTKRYIFGIDPASERDNFSIVIIEMRSDHRRIVYGWTTNREHHKKEISAGLVKELDYYSYCARKIRDLMKRFPCERIMMDSQGGGIAVLESLHDLDKIEDGEVPIWPVIIPDKPQDTDVKVGAHLVEMVNFASADWTSEANHNLRKDMEDRVLLFPYFDAITLARAETNDLETARVYDAIEDCVMEVEDLKNELSTIIITKTPNGRDKWDTPEIKLPGGKKDRLRKDRYSALLMANMGARQLARADKIIPYTATGGWAGQVKPQTGDRMYDNDNFNNWAKEAYR